MENLLLSILEKTPLIYIVLSLLAIIAFIIVVLIYTIAFFKGREISFWPPKIGQDITNTQEYQLPEILDLPESSTYDPSIDINRLKIQSDNHLEFDKKIFQKALQIIDKNNLIGLDIGCADGYVTYTRFENFNKFSKIIGIDNNSSLVSKAKRKYENNKFIFELIDIEKDNVNEILAKIGKVDFVYLGYVLQHLSDPVNVLLKIKKLLNKNGVIVIRTVDDSLKLFYSNYNNFNNDIFYKLIKTSKFNDDREHGRKLFYQLKLAKFKNINFNYEIFDTIHNSRDDIIKKYIESISWRPLSLELLIENKAKKDLIKEYEWAKKAAKVIENIFKNDEMLYYLEIQIVAIAQY